MSGGMGIGPRLELRQSQSLVMTPQLMQAIKMLQLSSIDLQAYVEQELERNPLLEMEQDSGSNDRIDAGEGEEPDPSANSLQEGDPGDLVAASSADMNEVSPAVDADLGEALDETSAWTPALSGGGPVTGSASEDYNLEDFAAEEVDLRAHVRRQLSTVPVALEVRAIADRIVDHLDDNGYLSVSADAVADELSAAKDAVDAAISLVQGCDPVGVGARNLAECLALQLKERNRHDPAIAALLENLELLARRDFTALRRVCSVSQDDLIEMVNEIRALDPKPGSRFGAAAIQPVVPDVFVRPRNDGGWSIDLNADTLPRLLVDRGYYSSVVGSLNGAEDRTWLNNCLQEANWLVKSLDQRARTVLKVSEEIVRQQDSFLVEGISQLRPLNLKTVADAIDMHESTVSRVTSNKYMATPRGVFELKFFFPTAIQDTAGSASHSGESVRFRIQELVDAEGDDILSDDQIVRVLRAHGVDIARRTVAKYREGLGIPSSVQRKRERKVKVKSGA